MGYTGSYRLKKILALFLPFLILQFSLSGCTVNPVTGRQEIALVSESMEIEIGEENYMPSRQMQGGDYVADPGLVEYVREVGNRIAAVSDRKLPYEFVVVNDSTPNAWALPGGKIAVHRGLLTELHDEAELAAVLGHEVVHAAARHSAKAMERALLLQGAVVAVAAMADSGQSDKWTGLLAVGGAQVAAMLLAQKFSRDAESEADHYGMIYMARAGYDPSAAVRLQETFVKLSKGRDRGWLEGLFSSHPPSEERVEANRATLAQLRVKAGYTGRDRYQRKIARLISTRPAYEAYEKGRKALEDGHPYEALKKAESAISIESREALFYALKGDALKRIGRPYDALSAYRHAEALNPDYYYPHQQRGLLLYRLGNLKEARQALEKGISLLKTAPAVYVLGRIARSEGRYDDARRYFKVAAESDSDTGRRALHDLLDMDLPARAGEYLSAELRAGERGELVLVVTNKTPFAMRGVTVFLETAARSGSITIPGHIKGGESRTIMSRPSNLSPEQVKAYRARVVSAYLAE